MMDKLQLAETLLASYRQDQAAGILDARLHWKEIDDEMLQIASGWADSALAELNAQDPVSLFGAAGYDWAFFVEAQNTVGFKQVINTVAEYRGDPPSSSSLSQYAMDILRGRVHLAGAIRLVATDAKLLSILPHSFQTFLPGVDPARYPALAQAVRVAAAAALPREELYQLRGLEEGLPQIDEEEPDTRQLSELREEYARLMDQADSLASEAKLEQQEEFLVRALEVAGQSPEPDDDIEALQRILHLAERFQVSPESVRRCTAAVELLVRSGHLTAAVAQCVSALGPLVQQHAMMEELGERLIRAGSRVTEGDIDEESRIGLKTTLARAWLELGREDQAQALLKEVNEARLTPLDRLSVAVMHAEALREKQDNSRAADLLLGALDAAESVKPVARIPALQKLLSVWPENRDTEGLLPYIDEVLKIANRLKEPRRTLCLVGSAIRLWPSGRKVQALRAWSMIDEDRIRREVPPVLAEKVLTVVERTKAKMDDRHDATVVH